MVVKKINSIYNLKNPPPCGWNIKDINKLKRLPGRLNRVHLAELKKSREKFVLKKLNKSDIYPLSSSLLLEKEIHLTANHPNVITTYGFFETASAVYLMMEFAEGGDLFTAALGSSDEQSVAHFIHGVALGLNYLHEMGIMHRDIKAENVVVTDSQQCKIIDFGMAAKLSLGTFLPSRSATGTLDYLSPEELWGLRCDHSLCSRQRKGSDVWSFGVLSYVLLCGHYPFVPHAEINSEERKLLLVNVFC